MATKVEFIQKIRAKYPQYDNVEDEVLFNKIIEKYPVYKDKIEDFSEEKTELSYESPTPTFDSGLGGAASDSLPALKNLVTGQDRMTQEMRDLPSIGKMPELQQITNVDSYKAAFANLTASPQEFIQVMQANYPGVGVRQDEKGNYIIRSSVDGQEYKVNEPGLDVRDVAKFGTQALLSAPATATTAFFGPAAGMAVEGGVQSLVETIHELSGGDFDKSNVIASSLMEGLIPAAGQQLKRGKKLVTDPFDKEGRTRLAMESTNPEDQFVQTSLTPEMIGKSIRKGASSLTEGGRETAAKDMLKKLEVDSGVVQAASDLGIRDILPPEALAKNDEFSSIMQAVKSQPGSISSALDAKNEEVLQDVARREIEKLGGKTDFSTLSELVNRDMFKEIDNLEKYSDDVYRKLENAIEDNQIEIIPENLLSEIYQRIQKLGGEKELSSVEKRLWKKFKNSDSENISYGLFDRERKLIGDAAFKGQGIFRNENTAGLKRLYSAMVKDQEEFARQTGDEAFDLFIKGREAVKDRVKIQENMESLFGKKLDSTIFPKLASSMNRLKRGDFQNFENLMKAVPKDRRQEVAASSLFIAMDKKAASGDLNYGNFADWFESISRNKQSMNALMSNLPKQARSRLNALATVSRAIQKAKSKRITTGRGSQAERFIEGSDNLLSAVMQSAKRSIGLGVLGEVVTTPMGAPGASILLAVANGMRSNKSTLKRADDFITSKEFLNAIKSIGTDMESLELRKLSKSEVFDRFLKSTKTSIPMDQREQWLYNAILGKFRQDEGEK